MIDATSTESRQRKISELVKAEMAKGFGAVAALRRVCGTDVVDSAIDILYYSLRAKATDAAIRSQRIGDHHTRYETPCGSFDNWQDAADACESSDFDATLCIKIVN